MKVSRKSGLDKWADGRIMRFIGNSSPKMNNSSPKSRRSFLGLDRVGKALKSEDHSQAPNAAANTSNKAGITRRSMNMLLLAAVAMISGGCRRSPKEASDMPVERPKPSNFDIIKEFSPSPDHASIVDSNLNNPGAKTIIYLVDKHPHPAGSDESQAPARAVQKHLFLVLEDILQKTGSLPTVIENWAFELSGQKFGDFSSISAGVSDPARIEILRQIFTEDNQEKKRTLIVENIEKFNIPGTVFLQIMYPDKFRSIGSVPYSELRHIMEQEHDLGVLVGISNTPEAYYCAEEGDLMIGKASELFKKGDRRAEITECYCNTRQQLQSIIDTFIKDRSITAPRREVQAAIEDKSDFVVISAGTNHLPEARRLMLGQGLNYIVIAPKGTEEDFPEALIETNLPRLMKNPLPNTDPKACEDWEIVNDARIEAARKEQEKAFMEWFMED